MTLPSFIRFEDTAIAIHDRDGTPWVTAADLARALGYSSEDAVSRIYRRNADEFDDSMTETVNLTVSGNLRTATRIFSPRGAHLIAMLARTPRAKSFRRFVLDVLDRLAANQLPQPTAAPRPLAPLYPSALEPRRILTLDGVSLAVYPADGRFWMAGRDIAEALGTDSIRYIAQRLRAEGRLLDGETWLTATPDHPRLALYALSAVEAMLRRSYLPTAPRLIQALARLRRLEAGGAGPNSLPLPPLPDADPTPPAGLAEALRRKARELAAGITAAPPAEPPPPAPQATGPAQAYDLPDHLRGRHKAPAAMLKLPFIRPSADYTTVDCWAPPRPDYSRATGMDWGYKAARLAADRKRSRLLWWTLCDMVRAGHLGAVETGFLAAIASHAIGEPLYAYQPTCPAGPCCALVTTPFAPIAMPPGPLSAGSAGSASAFA